MPLIKKTSAVVLSALVLYFFIASFVYATSEADLRQKIEAKNAEVQKLENEIKQYQGTIAQKNAVAKTLNSTISQINQQIKNLNYQLALTQTKISRQELEIVDLDAGIGKTLQSLAEQQQAIQEIIRQINDAESKSPVEIFFDYKTISSFFDSIEKEKNLTESIKDVYDKLLDTKKMLEIQKTSAQHAKDELVSLKGDLVDQRGLEQEQKAEKAQLLAITKNEEARFQKLLKEKEQRRLSIQKEIDSIEEELRLLINVNTLPAKGKGVLLWPLESIQITQGFGLTSFSVTTGVYKNNRHNGLDFRASIGTPIFAAADGTVKSTGDTDIVCRGGSYGRYVVIEHPNNLSTLYAHFSRVRVVAGQHVSRGDIIGLSGNTGYSTGPHLHFTVYASNTFRLAKTNNCGLVPAGGYLNPLDYL